ncbi:hypothetical protein C6497_15515 [Candidatus Poribacteria bacterium]|nr:MAG: hypothetical protein C6497_15515 [Candidatus Poribacteria bacterium]
MKRLIVICLSFVMLGCVLTLIWADVRSRNVSKEYAKHISSELDGPVYAEAYIVSDLDYPGEDFGIEGRFLGTGLDYEAWARFEGDKLNDDYEGTYAAYAGVPGDPTGDYQSRTDWDEAVDDEVESTGRYHLPKNPEEWSDSDKERYGNWNDIQAETDLSLCSAWADINGASPARPGRWVRVDVPSNESGTEMDSWLEWQPGREAESHSASANAWKWPDTDPHNHN